MASAANLGYAYRQSSDLERSQTMTAQALRLARELGDRLGCYYGLAGLGIVALHAGRLDRAIRLLSAGEAWRRTAGLTPISVVDPAQVVAAVREQFGPDRTDVAWVEGQAMLLEQAIAYALDDTWPTADDETTTPSIRPIP
jgi:hypothetical protein